jgi:hypothetical protein
MKNLISTLLTLSVFTSCHKVDESAATLKGIVGEDNSAKAKDKAEFADLLTRQTDIGLVLNCNGVKLSDGRFLTAAHCLKPHAGKDVQLLGRKIVTNLHQVGSFDLVVGQLIGGAAPSESIRLFSGTISSTVQLEANWFDYKTGEWRVSRGEGTVEGAFIKHNLDTNPGSSGSALYTVDSSGQKLLVGVHIGFAKEANTNVGVLLSKALDANFSPSSAELVKYEAEDTHVTYVCSRATGECYRVQESDNGSDEGGNGGSSGGDGGNPSGPSDGAPGGGGDGGSVGGGGDSGGGDSGGIGDGGDSGGDGDYGEGGDGNDGGDYGGGEGGVDGGSDGGSSGGIPGVVIIPEVVPGGSAGHGGSSKGGAAAKDCFNCDRLSWELKNNDLFKPECETPGVAPNLKPMLKGTKIELVDGAPLPEFRFNPSDDKFTQSLKDFAEKLKEATKWKTTPELADKMAKLSKEELERLQKWMESVVKNLDDYYALLVASMKSDQLTAPDEIPEVDVSKEGIDAAKRYLDAVKKQIAQNPDQYLEARLSLADSSARALDIATEALESGDKETAEAAISMGRALADASLGWVPGVGFAKDLVEATTGYNYITKQELTRFEVVSAWVGVFSAGYGSKILATGKAIKLVAVAGRIAKTSKLGAKLEQYGVRAKEIYDVASKAGIKDRKRIGEVFDAVKRRLPSAKFEELEEEVANAFKRYEGLPLINGKKPRNGHYAGNTYYEGLSDKLKGKYPDGVKFNEKGFPDFSPYAMKFENGNSSVVIQAGLSPKADFAAANKAAGLAKKPKGFTWHHHEDTGVMQLIPTDLHKAVGHTGGWVIWSGGLKL